MCRKNKIALFLDVDGVLNQYMVSERKRRVKTKGFFNVFDPFPKKVIRLHKLIKRYDIDVYVFSAWTKEKLQHYLPFKLCGDTFKLGKFVNKVSEEYKHSVLIDDEASVIFDEKERYNINEKVIKYQPNGDIGLVLNDFKKLDKLFRLLVDIED